MAGTRLWVVSTFFGPFLAWTAVSVYFGIFAPPRDLLAVQLLPQSGRHRLQRQQQQQLQQQQSRIDHGNNNSTTKFPPIRVLVMAVGATDGPKTERALLAQFWKEEIQKALAQRGGGGVSSVEVILAAADEPQCERFRRVCSDPAQPQFISAAMTQEDKTTYELHLR
jgi:hypothetical protein